MLFTAEFVAGFGVMILDISIGTIVAAVVPDPLRARVSGAFQAINYGTRPVGSLVGGAVGTLLGLHPALWIAAAGGTLGFLCLLPSPMPRFRLTQPEGPASGPRSAEPEARASGSPSAEPGRSGQPAG
jgi:MFS family permease